ncbi:MAG TPA: T9SS type A sorting domain-containing protein [Flavobacteriaceae bacterium]|nr:T9SS type A sorting domain-containing protein [Flavobacteriaceae bacterium]
MRDRNVEFVFRDIGGRQIHVPRTTIKNSFNATSLPPGIYFAKVKSVGFQETVKMLKVE